MAVAGLHFRLKLLWFYSPENFSNTYLLGPREGGPAIMIDPGVFHPPLVEALRQRRWNIEHILITRGAQAHLKGLRTLLKIFPARLYARAESVFEFPCHQVAPPEVLELDGISVQVIAFPELSPDSVAYRIGKLVFSGDVLTAGDIGYEFGFEAQDRSAIRDAIRRRIMDPLEDLMIYPGAGPPTSLLAERKTNPWLQPSEPPTPG